MAVCNCNHFRYRHDCLFPITGHVSRVFTEASIRLAWNTGAAYAEGFLGALQGQRISGAYTPSPGSTLLELFLNLFDTSDPFLAAEVVILHSWLASTSGWGAPALSTRGDSGKLHSLTPEFKAQWPPPAERVKQILREQPGFFNPLSQDRPRIYLNGYHRKRV